MTADQIQSALEEIIPSGTRWPFSRNPVVPKVDKYDEETESVIIDLGMSRFVEISTFDKYINEELSRRFPTLKIKLVHHEDW